MTIISNGFGDFLFRSGGDRALRDRPRSRPCLISLWTIAAMVASGGAAHAQVSGAAPTRAEPQPAAGDGRGSDWNVTIGAGALVVPEYEGSKDLRIFPLPLVDVTWRERIFVNPTDGIGVYAVRSDHVTLGVSVTYAIGRDASRSPKLRGLKDISDTARPRVFGRLDLGPFYLDAGVSRDVGGSKGVLADAGAGVAVPLTSRFQLTAGANVSYGDARYMRTFFGVTPEQGAASGLRTYTIGAGLRRADAQVGMTYRLSRHWLLIGTAGTGRLAGDAARSPVVERRWQPFGQFAVGYRF